jgi:drug/metabolite transporter (DMT)-like permease
VNRRGAAELALAGNTLVWGSTFVLVKDALGAISPVLFLAVRFSLAAAVLALIYRNIRTRPGVGSELRAGALAGVFLFLGYLFQTQGLRFTTAPKSAFITGLTSVLVPLLGSLVYRNKPQVSELLGVLIATIGLALMTLPAGSNPIGAINRGDLLTMACAVAFAAHIVTLGHFSERMSFDSLSVAQIGAAAALALALFPVLDQPHVAWSSTVIFAIVITGLFATALAFTVQAWAQSRTTSTRTALIYMLEPVVAWATSYFLTGEGLSPRATAGAGMILGGVLLVELKPLGAR